MLCGAVSRRDNIHDNCKHLRVRYSHYRVRSRGLVPHVENPAIRHKFYQDCALEPDGHPIVLFHYNLDQTGTILLHQCAQESRRGILYHFALTLRLSVLRAATANDRAQYHLQYALFPLLHTKP